MAPRPEAEAAAAAPVPPPSAMAPGGERSTVVEGAGKPEARSGPSPWPWIAIGTGAVAAGVGVVLGARNAALISEGESSVDPVRIEELKGQVSSTGLAANVLFGTAAVAVVTGIVLFLVQ